MLTIDDRSTRDMDDAIEVQETPDGGWIVKVAIADAARIITPNSNLDIEARQRGSTHYFAGGSSPMLPRDLSEWKLSLWPNVEKSVILVEMELSPNLEVISKKLSVERITSEDKLSYAAIPGILDQPEHPRHAQILTARKLAMGLLTKRRQNGAMVFYDLNQGWVTTEEGFLKKLKSLTDTIGYVIIQELMILANVAVATYAVEQNVPVLFRNHEARSAAPDREALMRQIVEAMNTPILDIDSVRKRNHILLDRAEYGASLLGHYGLNVPAYLHFTSPIRRYADLVTHQQLRAHLKGKPLSYTKEQLEELCQHLNVLAKEHRDSTREHFKGQAERKAARQVDARVLEAMPAKDFERVVKVETRSGAEPSEALVEAWVRRLDDDMMPLICVTTVIVYDTAPPGWEMLKGAAVDFLARHTADAVSLLTQAVTLGWPEVTYECAQSGPAHAPSFTAKATREGLEVTVQGKSSKEAKQRAAVTILAAIVGAEPPEWEVAKPEVKSEPQQAKPVLDSGKHPVSALMEYSQSTKKEPPKFDLRMSGPAHIPTVTCVATFSGHRVESVATTKQEAKTLAAKGLLEKLTAGS